MTEQSKLPAHQAYWLEVAMLAEKYNIRYGSNASLTAFLEMVSRLSPPYNAN